MLVWPFAMRMRPIAQPGQAASRPILQQSPRQSDPLLTSAARRHDRSAARRARRAVDLAGRKLSSKIEDAITAFGQASQQRRCRSADVKAFIWCRTSVGSRLGSACRVRTGPRLRRHDVDANLSRKNVQRLTLFRHVVVPVVVPRLHAGQPVRLQVSADVTADAIGRKQRLHSGSDSL